MTNNGVSSSISSGSRAVLIPCSKYPNDCPTRAKIQKIVERALACPILEELAKNSYEKGDPLHGKKGSLEIIYDPITCKKMGSWGFTDHTNRYIVLSTLNPVKALDILIFEVSNASQTAQYRVIQEQVKKGTISCDAYAKAIEQIEHFSSVKHHEIVQWGMNNLKWSPDLDAFKDLAKKNFEIAWHQHIRFSPHAQLYRKQYAILTKTDETRPGWKEKIDSRLRVLMYLIRDLFHRIASRCQRIIKRT